MSDGKRKSDCDRRIHGVATFTEDLEARLRRHRLVGDDHAGRGRATSG
jgi:hypothetical protein